MNTSSYNRQRTVVDNIYILGHKTNHCVAVRVVNISRGLECMVHRVGQELFPLYDIDPEVKHDYAEVLDISQAEGVKHVVPMKWLNDEFRNYDNNYDNLLNLDSLTMRSLVVILQKRYLNNEIYSSVGDQILIAVNPYQSIPSLTDYVCKNQYKYEFVKSNEERSLPPHPYQLAQDSLSSLNKNKTNQSIIISGESGSGKTETTKILINYLSDLDGKSLASALQSINPLMESFGNSRTERNDNSSRFGKFISLVFNKDLKQICHCSIDTYLLEKCRVTLNLSDNNKEDKKKVTCSTPSKRYINTKPEKTSLDAVYSNFHIFYMVIYGIHADKENNPNYKYLEKFFHEDCFECCLLGRLEDNLTIIEEYVLQYNELKECIKLLNIENFYADIQKILISCILLGELTLIEDYNNEILCVDEKNYLDSVLELLNCDLDLDKFQKLLTTKTIFDVEKKQELRFPRSLEDSLMMKDSIIKNLYEFIFQNIVIKLNSILKCDMLTCGGKSINLLDIYGFEVFGERNGFEQLCINYANETLQSQFTNYVLEDEQKMYKSEQLVWNHVAFNDNDLILLSFRNKATGIWNLLDSECQRPQGNDDNLCRLIQKQKASNRPKNQFILDTHFCIDHYAGEVTYDSTNFVIKNRDVGLKESSTLIANIHNSFSLEKEDITEDKKSRKLFNDSVSKLFCIQLDDLMKRLQETRPKYIRCIKPNERKKPNMLLGLELLRQLESGGMLESIKVRRNGYPVRLTKEDFYKDFCAPCGFRDDGNEEEMMKECFEYKFSENRDSNGVKLWQIGLNCVFMKQRVKDLMDFRLFNYQESAAITIQQFYRGHKVRQGRRSNTAAISIIQRLIKKQQDFRRMVELNAALVLQKNCRMTQERQEIIKRFDCDTFIAVTLQCLWRRKVADRLLKDIKFDIKFNVHPDISPVHWKKSPPKVIFSPPFQVSSGNSLDIRSSSWSGNLSPKEIDHMNRDRKEKMEKYNAVCIKGRIIQCHKEFPSPLPRREIVTPRQGSDPMAKVLLLLDQMTKKIDNLEAELRLKREHIREELPPVRRFDILDCREMLRTVRNETRDERRRMVPEIDGYRRYLNRTAFERISKNEAKYENMVENHIEWARARSPY